MAPSLSETLVKPEAQLWPLTPQVGVGRRLLMAPSLSKDARFPRRPWMRLHPTTRSGSATPSSARGGSSAWTVEASVTAEVLLPLGAGLLL